MIPREYLRMARRPHAYKPRKVTMARLEHPLGVRDQKAMVDRRSWPCDVCGCSRFTALHILWRGWRP